MDGFASLVVIIFWLGLLTLLVAFAVVLTPQNHEKLIERFGRYVGTRRAGLSFKIPFLEWATGAISMQLQETKVKVEIRTKDNVFAHMPITVQFRVTDSKKWYYESEDPLGQLCSLIINTSRSFAAGKDMNELFSITDDLHKAVDAAVATFVEKYGCQIENLVVDQPDPSAELKVAYERVVASLRAKESAANEGEAQRILRVASASAEAEAMKLQGQGLKDMRVAAALGIAETMKQFMDAGVSPEQAQATLLILAHQDAVREAAKNGNVILASLDPGSNMDAIKHVAAALASVKTKP